MGLRLHQRLRLQLQPAAQRLIEQGGIVQTRSLSSDQADAGLLSLLLRGE